MGSKVHIIQKIHLVISVWVVIPVAFVYGFNIDSQLEIFPKTIDEHNFLKAVMGIYLGFAILWILGIFRKEYLKSALISHVMFMLGLGFGRLLSFAMDGLPSDAYLIGTFGELLLGFYGVWILTKKNTNFAKNN
jgi:hypothetical protein